MNNLVDAQFERAKVVVALAVYNGETWLSEQLDSILKQNDVCIQVVISIDPSTDRSREICERYASKFPNITLLADVGKFGNAANNFFRLVRDIDCSDMDFFSFSDQDDIWNENKLVNAVACMRGTHSDGYSSNLTAFSESENREWLIAKSSKVKNYDYLFQGASAGCTYVLSKVAFEKVQCQLKELLSDNNVMTRPSHDWTVYAICRSFGFKWFFDQKSYIQYRQHENNFYGAKTGVKGVLKKIKIIRSGWYREQIYFLKKGLKGSEEEERIFLALFSHSLFNRLWLVLKVIHFRREGKQQLLLAVLFLFGRW